MKKLFYTFIKKSIIISIFIILLITIHSNFKNETSVTKTTFDVKNIIKSTIKEKHIIDLTIKKIKLYGKVFAKDSINNNVDKNITMLYKSNMPEDKNGVIILAAHSGTGPIAYFKNLDKLEINDEILLKYKEKNYKYIVSKIDMVDKNGFIEFEKLVNKNMLVLTTCMPNIKGKQLIIIATLFN